MFQVHVYLYVWDSANLELSENWAAFHKRIELPFAPFIGLEIKLPLDTMGCRIESVSWDVEGGFFRCKAEDLFANTVELDQPVFEEWLEDLAETGWTSDGIRPKLS